MGVYASPKFKNKSGNPTDKAEWFKTNGEVVPIYGCTDMYIQYKESIKNNKHLVCVYNGGDWVGAAVMVGESDLMAWLGDPRILFWCVVENEKLEPIVEEDYKFLFKRK
jgi:hypothetical protein